jgi:hypothetical protein
MTKGRAALASAAVTEDGQSRSFASYWGKAKLNKSLPDATATYCLPPTA